MSYLKNAHLEEVGKGTLVKRLSKTAGWVAQQGGDQVLVLHNTPIITIRADDGAAILNSGGWKTPTTKKYMNEGLADSYFHGWMIYQMDSRWYLQAGGWGARREGRTEPYGFKDGMTILPDGTVIGASAASPKQHRHLVKTVNKYVDGFIKALFNGSVPAPSGGDCWDCAFRVDGTDQTWGESKENSDHILSHIKEGYYVPSLLQRAVEVYRISPIATTVLATLWGLDTGWSKEDTLGWAGGIAESQIKSSLRRYVRQQLGLPPI